MRPAQIAGASMLLTVVCAAPATADPVDLPDALAAVDAACTQTRSTLTTSGGKVVDGDTTVTLAGGRFAVAGPGSNRVAVAGEGTYGALSDDGLRRKERKAALGYLKRPGATSWFNAGAFWSPSAGWTASFAESVASAIPLPASCAQELAAAGDPVDRDGQRWEFAMPGQGAFVVVEDGLGRLSQFGSVSVSYAAQSVSTPAAAVGFAAWQKASQAASLNSTMKQITRSVAAAVNADEPTVAAIDAAIRAAVPTDRVVPLKVRQLRRGVLVHSRNPYTKTYHAWRVYLKKGEAVARRVAP